MATLGAITAKLTADIKDFEAKMEDAKKLVGQVEKESGGMSKKMSVDWAQVTKASKLFLGTVTAISGAISAYAVKATLTAARTETMGIAMEAVAKSTNNSMKELKEQEAILKKQGITTQESRNILTRFMQSQLDVADASKIARIAQDLAVVAGENSSEMTGRLTDAIATMNPMLLRQAGIVINQNELFDAYAKTLGKTGEELTQTEKKQAMVWQIMREGEKVAGSYEMAMETAGKKMGSLARYFEEAENIIGQKFLPIFNNLIDRVTEFMKQITPERVDEIFAKIEEWGLVIIGVIVGGITPALWAMLAPLLPLLKIILILVAIGATVGLILKSLGIDMEDISNFIKDDLIPAVISAKDWFLEAWKTVKEKWEEYGQPIFDFVVEFINNTLVPAWEYLKESIEEALQEAGMEMDDFIEILKIVGILLGGVVLGAVLGFVAALSGLIFTLGLVIKWSIELRKRVLEQWDYIVDRIAWHINKIRGIFNANSFKEGLLNAMKYPFEAFWHWITGLFDRIRKKIQDALDLTKRHSPSVIDVLVKGIDIAEKELEGLSDMRITPMANLMGEGVSGASGGISLSINMAGANISSEEVAQEYAERIGDAIVGKLRTNRRSYV